MKRFNRVLTLALCWLLLCPPISAASSSSRSLPLKQYKRHELPVNIERITDCSGPFQDTYAKQSLHGTASLRVRHSEFDKSIVIAMGNYSSQKYVASNIPENSCAIAIRISLRKSDNNYSSLFGHQCFLINNIHTPVSNTFEKKDRDNANRYYLGFEVKVMKTGKLTPYVLVFVFEKTDGNIKSPDIFYLVQADDWKEVFDKEDTNLAMNPYFRNADKQ